MTITSKLMFLNTQNDILVIPKNSLFSVKPNKKTMRLPGFEPEFLAWEAKVIPLNYSRTWRI